MDGAERPSIRSVTIASMEAGRRAAAERHERSIARTVAGAPLASNRGTFRPAVRDRVDGVDIIVIQRDTLACRMRNEDVARATLRGSIAGALAGLSFAQEIAS